MTETETRCANCGIVNESRPSYCPDCGAEQPWVEKAMYDWERDVDLPVVFSYHVYDDYYELWESFCNEVWGVYGVTGKEIANMPDGLPRMKYFETELWFKLTEEFVEDSESSTSEVSREERDTKLELKGPFLDKREAREA